MLLSINFVHGSGNPPWHVFHLRRPPFDDKCPLMIVVRALSFETTDTRRALRTSLPKIRFCKETKETLERDTLTTTTTNNIYPGILIPSKVSHQKVPNKSNVVMSIPWVRGHGLLSKIKYNRWHHTTVYNRICPYHHSPPHKRSGRPRPRPGVKKFQ